MVGNLQIERRGDVHDGKRSAGVPRTGRMQGDQVIAAHQVGGVFQFFNGILAEDLPADGIRKGHDSPLPRRTERRTERALARLHGEEGWGCDANHIGR